MTEVVTSCTHGTTVAPGHHPAREGVTLPPCRGTVVVAQSVRHTLVCTVCAPKVNVCGCAQNSEQFCRLPWPCPVMKERISAPVAPGGTATVCGLTDIGTGTLGSPKTNFISSHNGMTAIGSLAGVPPVN